MIYNRIIQTTKYSIYGNKQSDQIKVIDKETKQEYIIKSNIQILICNFMTDQTEKYIDNKLKRLNKDN